MPYLLHARQALRGRHWLAASMILIGLAVIPEVCAAQSPGSDECRKAGDSNAGDFKAGNFKAGNFKAGTFIYGAATASH
jgi:hypothetical protein